MKAAIPILGALLLGGCAGFSPDGGFGAVESAVLERTGQKAQWVRSEDEANSVRARVQELLAQPLTAESAAQIALLNNPGLQASYAELGIAEADLVQASRWSGPTFSFARLRRGNETEYERSVFLDILGLVTIPLQPQSGRPYNPVVTLNGWTLPWRMKDGWKEFHLVAEPVRRQMAPGMTAHLWSYNGQSPGPTIECVEGDKVRIFVTNKLPEHTTIHWHGVLLPAGMDGVGGLTQPQIPVGKTFVYEFAMKKSGTFMYHPHADEMVQMAMGMMGFLVVHPKNPGFMKVDRDFVFLINAYDIDPGSYTPKVNTMTDFNLWSWNSRVFPGIDHLVVRKGDRVRVRIGNLTMTNHPIHLHGVDFEVTCTDGGWVPKSARWPEVTTDVAVGQMRAIEFIANAPGDWAFHCHKSHHTMNPMGHNVPTMIGVDHRGIAEKIVKLVPDYMVMGERGMADMGEMEMPLPDNTLPMMTGTGPFGPLEMGGMFTVVKVREGLARNDYKDPGWYKHPEGTVAYAWTGAAPLAQRKAPAPAGGQAMKVRKPATHRH